MQGCHFCDVAELENVYEREFTWDFRPKDWRIPRKITVLHVDLCDDCYNLCDPEFVCIGWDWWDAIDGLVGEMEYRQEAVKKEFERHFSRRRGA